MQDDPRQVLTRRLAELDALSPPEVMQGCPTDAADVAMRSRELAEGDRLLADRHRQRTELQDALSRLEGGQYGLCENCEEPIRAARLRALPHATLCAPCQHERESDIGR